LGHVHKVLSFRWKCSLDSCNHYLGAVVTNGLRWVFTEHIRRKPTTHLVGSLVGNNLFLGFWTSKSIRGFSAANYMAVYAALGFVQALFAFFLSYALAYVSNLILSFNFL
jgi:hypothetical protein